MRTLLRRCSVLSICALGSFAGCGQAKPLEGEPVASQSEAVTTSVIKHVFVVAMENHDASQVYGDTADAPYINNTLIPAYAHSVNFNDDLALSLPSEPHYVWIEGGTNAFSDHTFTTDDDPSSSNSTSSTSHLATQINNATSGVTWRTYQEGLDAATGELPHPQQRLLRRQARPVRLLSRRLREPPLGDELVLREPPPRLQLVRVRSRAPATSRATRSSRPIYATTCTARRAALIRT